jgi:hypothetical protein
MSQAVRKSGSSVRSRETAAGVEVEPVTRYLHALALSDMTPLTRNVNATTAPMADSYEFTHANSSWTSLRANITPRQQGRPRASGGVPHPTMRQRVATPSSPREWRCSVRADPRQPVPAVVPARAGVSSRLATSSPRDK